MLLITELWQRSEGRSSSGAGGMQPPGFSMPGMIRKSLPPGNRTSIGSFMSSTYAQWFLLWRR